MTKKHITVLRVSILLILTITLILVPNEGGEEPIQPEQTYTVIEVLPAPQPLPEPIPVILAVPNVMAKIAWCESQNRQFNSDGSVLQGKINPLDTGKFQLNKKYHLADSQRLGMDIETLEGNTEYAYHLYKTQGTIPWSWSEHCWADPTRVWWTEGGEYWSK